MNLDQLEAVIAVVEQGSFRAAAETLRRSQPALSATIKNLEEEFAILIFDRSAYRPKLTDAGAAFLRVARPTVEAAQYAARVAAELGQHKVESRLRISVDALISTKVLRVLAAASTRPTLPVNLIIDKSILRGSYQPLLDGKIDLAIAPCPQNEDKVEKIILETVTLAGAFSRQLLPRNRKISSSAIASFISKKSQILVYDRPFGDAPDEPLLQALQHGNGHKIFVPDHFSKKQMIEAGVGWGRISEAELASNRELVRLDHSVCAPIKLELSLLRAKNRAIGPTAIAIWQTFQEWVQNDAN